MDWPALLAEWREIRREFEAIVQTIESAGPEDIAVTSVPLADLIARQPIPDNSVVSVAEPVWVAPVRSVEPEEWGGTLAELGISTAPVEMTGGDAAAIDAELGMNAYRVGSQRCRRCSLWHRRGLFPLCRKCQQELLDGLILAPQIFASVGRQALSPSAI